MLSHSMGSRLVDSYDFLSPPLQYEYEVIVFVKRRDEGMKWWLLGIRDCFFSVGSRLGILGIWRLARTGCESEGRHHNYALLSRAYYRISSSAFSSDVSHGILEFGTHRLSLGSHRGNVKRPGWSICFIGVSWNYHGF